MRKAVFPVIVCQRSSSVKSGRKLSIDSDGTIDMFLPVDNLEEENLDKVLKDEEDYSTVAQIPKLWTEGQGQFVLACNFFVWNATEKLLLPLEPSFRGLFIELGQKIYFYYLPGIKCEKP